MGAQVFCFVSAASFARLLVLMRLHALSFAVATALAVDPGSYDLVAHLRLRRLDEFERRFWAISTPGHAEYLKHLSVEEVGSIVGAHEDDVDAAKRWFEQMGADGSSIRVSPLRDAVTARFLRTVAGNLTSGKLHGGAPWPHIPSEKPPAVEFLLRRDAPVATPDGQQAPAAGTGADSKKLEYTIANVKAAYGMPVNLQATSNKVLQMVWGPGTFGYSPAKLLELKQTQCPLLNMSRVRFDTENHGKEGGDNFGEGQLDANMITAFGLNIDTLVSNTNSSASTEEGSGFGQALLDFLTELASRPHVPHVLSISLGGLEAASCDLLCNKVAEMGESLEDCQQFLQDQRQVCMFLSQSQVARLNVAYQILGARGVTVFGPSGDGGSHFSFEKYPGDTHMAQAVNEVSCRYQMPCYPSSNPYQVTVGGTMWDGSPSNPVAWAVQDVGGGGGFGRQFEMPAHQKRSVAAYLQSAHGLPPRESYRSDGRAFPDMSALGVSGTSQSAPVAAGIFSMITDFRVNAGLPPLGFLGPRLWKVAEDFPGEAFQDVTQGNTSTTCNNGFPAAPGWDAATGWGRPIWAGLLKHFASDDLLWSPHQVAAGIII